MQASNKPDSRVESHNDFPVPNAEAILGGRESATDREDDLPKFLHDLDDAELDALETALAHQLAEAQMRNLLTHQVEKASCGINRVLDRFEKICQEQFHGA